MEKNHVLLVEGKTDLFVIRALATRSNLSVVFEIVECGSDISMLKRLNAMIIQPNPAEVIGVVLDADEPGVSRRWQQVSQKLKDYDYRFPQKPVASGTILESTGDLPILGIWLMPDNRAPGMLEDFLLKSVNNEAVQMAEHCIDIAKEKGVTTFKSVHHSKAVLHTWLAWQDEPGRPLGQAITTNVLKHDSPSARDFIHWLQILFER